MFRLSQKPKPLVLCVLDGWGIAPDYPGNAITQANCTNFNKLWFNFPHTLLSASSLSVGLPQGVVGTSEVGHLNLGAGMIVFQDVLRIDNAIDDGTFDQNEAFTEAIALTKKRNSRIHLIGLVGPGLVHSSTSHLLALLDLVSTQNIPSQKVKIHIFTDGRDSPPSSAKDYISSLIGRIEGKGVISSISGRYFAMDRDNRWDRTEKAYVALLGNSLKRSKDPIKAIIDSYADGITDEFIEPTVITANDGSPAGAIKEGDSVIFFNFRPDRARQLTKAFVLDDIKNLKTSSGEKAVTFDRGPKLENIFFTSMTDYEKGLPVSAIAFEKHRVVMPMARVFSESADKQFHIAETEKYAHVTYFFNGGIENAFPGEDRLLINSKKVSTYDQVPEMSAPEITRELIKRINTRAYDFIIVNYANADMVSHTGNLRATIKAVQAVDFHLGILAKAILSIGGALIITADHGNAEVMLNPQTREVDTAHNLSPVPCIFIANDLQGKPTQVDKGILADVAPTILSMLNIPKPPSMSGRNLLE